MVEAPVLRYKDLPATVTTAVGQLVCDVILFALS